MKVKNIVFSGFAAAILMGTAGANAATPFKIASQAYVDRQIENLTGADGAVSQLEEKVAGENETLSNAFESGTTLTGAVNELATDVANAASAAQDAADAASAAQDAADAAQGEVDALETVVAGKADAAALGAGIGTGAGEKTVAAALAEKVNVADKATSIGSTTDASDSKWATEKAVAAAIANVTGGGATIGVLSDGNGGTYASVAAALADKADASDVTALETVVGDASSGLVADVTALETAVGDANSGLTKGVADNAAAITSINTALGGKQAALSQTELDSITAAANLLAAGYQTCISQSGGSGHCVLTAASNGLTWIDVTSPFEITE